MPASAPTATFTATRGATVVVRLPASGTAPNRAGQPSAATRVADGRVPRVARMLALAHHWRGLIRGGIAKDQADLARLVGVSRARVTQVMDLLYLAPDIQEEILFLGATEQERAADRVHGDLLPLAAQPAWDTQRRMWRKLHAE